jgi:hypothetical protein
MAQANAQPRGVEEIPWRAGMDPPISGYDSLLRVPSGQPFVRDGAPSFSNASGVAFHSLKVTRVESVHDLQDVLRTEARVSGSYELFSGSSAMAITHAVTMNTYSIYFLISAVAVGNVRPVTPAAAKIRPEILSSMDRRAFLREYGDYYVTGQKKAACCLRSSKQKRRPAPRSRRSWPALVRSTVKLGLTSMHSSPMQYRRRQAKPGSRCR